MILHFYFARRFMIIFAALMAVMFSLIVLVDLVDQTRTFGAMNIGFGQILTLTFLNAPAMLNQIMPLIIILTTIALFIALARSSELVVTRAAGRSGLSTMTAPVVLTVLIGALSATVLNPIISATSKKYEEMAEAYRTGGAATLSISDQGLWLRQGDADSQTVINARRSNSDGSVLYDVLFVQLQPDVGAVRRVSADNATLQSDGWMLANVKEWPLTKGINPEASSATFDQLLISSTLTIERIRNSLGRPSAISIWDLPEFIEQLDQAGFSSRKHRVYFQAQLARPLFLTAMVLVAAAFTMRHARFGGTGIAVLSAILTGFALYFIRSFAQILGENSQIPIVLAAWAPPVAAVCLGLGLLLHAEDG